MASWPVRKPGTKWGWLMPCVGLAHWGSDILVVGQEIPTACVITGSCDLIVVDTLAGCPHICPDLKLYYSSPVVSTTTTASSRAWLNEFFFFFFFRGREELPGENLQGVACLQTRYSDVTTSVSSPCKQLSILFDPNKPSKQNLTS